MTEAEILKKIRIRAPYKRARLWRNSIGSYKFGEHWVKYGLQNPGGSDLIGFTIVNITPDMVGKSVAIFTAVEVKTDKGRITKDQEAFIKFVSESGAIAGVCRSVEDLDKLLGGHI